MSRIFFARSVNIYMGGNVISPWQIDELDDEYVDAFLALFGAKDRVAQEQKNEKIHEEYRRAHPTFGKVR